MDVGYRPVNGKTFTYIRVAATSVSHVLRTPGVDTRKAKIFYVKCKKQSKKDLRCSLCNSAQDCGCWVYVPPPRYQRRPWEGKASWTWTTTTTKKHQRDRDRESVWALKEPLALITGCRLLGCGAWTEPHETSSHPALVDNLRVTWEIQHQGLWLPRQHAQRRERVKGQVDILYSWVFRTTITSGCFTLFASNVNFCYSTERPKLPRYGRTSCTSQATTGWIRYRARLHTTLLFNTLPDLYPPPNTLHFLPLLEQRQLD